MRVTITARGKQGAGKTRLLQAIVRAAITAGVLPPEAIEIEPENVKGSNGKLVESVTIKRVPPIPLSGEAPDGKTG